MTLQRNLVTGRPSDLFPGQIEGEEVLIFVRRHWLAFLPWILIAFFLLCIAVVVSVLLVISGTMSRILEGNALVYASAGSGFYLLFLNALFLTAWIEHYLDVSMITTDRLVNIHQIGLFNRRVSELPITKVQDVSAQMRGYFQSLFQYGTVVVETAGESPNFVMRYVPRPHIVANTILTIHDKLQGDMPQARQTMQVIEERMQQQSEGSPFSKPPLDYGRSQMSENLTQTNRPEAESQPVQQDLVPAQPVDAGNRLRPPSVQPKGEGELSEGELVSVHPDN